MFILLTPEQAEHVRGLTSEGAALMPVMTANGMYVLPVEVLDDPAHAMHHEYLSGLPQVENVDFPPPVDLVAETPEEA